MFQFSVYKEVNILNGYVANIFFKKCKNRRGINEAGNKVCFLNFVDYEHAFPCSVLLAMLIVFMLLLVQIVMQDPRLTGTKQVWKADSCRVDHVRIVSYYCHREPQRLPVYLISLHQVKSKEKLSLCFN